MAHRAFNLALAAFVGFGATLPLAAPGFAAEPIEVVMNEAKILKLARNANTIVVGNPAIADASVQDARTIVLTGKGFGSTNLVILDENGAPILDERVMVKRSDFATMRVYRRNAVSTLSCTPFCESTTKSDAEAASDATVGN
jgi:Flp pilus assembly secretin CpaC